MTEIQAARAVLGCIEGALGPAMRASLAGGPAPAYLHIEGADFIALTAAISAYHIAVNIEMRAAAISCLPLPVRPPERQVGRTHEEAAALFPNSLYFPWDHRTSTYGQAFADAKAHGARLGMYHIAGQSDTGSCMDNDPDGCIVGGKAGEPPPTRFPMLHDVTLYWRDRKGQS